MKKFKLFLTYKKKHQIIKNDYLIPIQTGRAIADEVFDDMIGDDTGDNISILNSKYNELSAQYWVWKNYDKIENPDYIGFMHYRRHFCFDDSLFVQKQNTWLKNSNVYRLNSIDDEYITINFDESKINETLKNTDCLVLKKYDVKNLGDKTIRERFGKLPEQESETFDIMLTSIVKLFPEYKNDINDFRKTSIQYLCNMFIMKKELFFEYSNFLFSVLKDVEKQIDSKHFNTLENRFIGYLGELVLSIFIKHKYRKSKIRIKELNGFLIEDMPYQKEIKPVFEGKYTTIAMSSSNEYAPYLSVCLKSLIDNSKESNKYDILIFERNICNEYKEKIKKFVEQPNISLRFITIHNQFKDIQIPKSHYQEECSYRVLAPVLLKNYKKIIFTDCDLIFNDDVAKLYQTECSTAIACCRDPMMNAHYGLKWTDWRDYCSYELKLENIYDYFNTGVMIINIEHYLNKNIYKKAINLLNSKVLRTLEQDALNSILQNNITYLDLSWNFPTLQKQMKEWKFLDAMDEETKFSYNKVKKNPKIIHYAAASKPWFLPEEDFADTWWSYARKTPFYEEILKRMLEFNIKNKYIGKDGLRTELANVHFPRINGRFSKNEYDLKLAYVMKHLLFFRCKKFSYVLRKAFTFGKKYEKYNQKYNTIKQLINDAKKIKSNFRKI